MPHPTPQISEFIDYLNAHYVGPDALCPPSMWAGTSARLTNNGAEAFHRHFGDLFGYLRANPTVWHFLRNLRIFNVLKDVKLRSFQPEPAPKTTEAEVTEQLTLHHQHQLTSRALLYKLSKKNQPKTRK